jgi:hypothetical protein
MGWLANLFGKGPDVPPPLPARPNIERWAGGTTVIDLTATRLDPETFVQVGARLPRLGAPRLRVWLLPAAELRRRAGDVLGMRELLRGLHAASLGRDQDGERAPDVAVLCGALEGTAGAVYLLWSLGIAPFPLGDDGLPPIIESKTALGQWVAGAYGTPLGEEPAKSILRGVYLTRDKIDAEPAAADADAIEEEATRVKKLLDIELAELNFIESVLEKS